MTSDKQLIVNVWLKGDPIPGYDPRVWRRDAFGNVILFSARGDRRSEYGWEIDHIVPLSRGGNDHITNLRPLHWRSNLARRG